jgi:hypothetical protein
MLWLSWSVGASGTGCFRGAGVGFGTAGFGAAVVVCVAAGGTFSTLDELQATSATNRVDQRVIRACKRTMRPQGLATTAPPRVELRNRFKRVP